MSSGEDWLDTARRLVAGLGQSLAADTPADRENAAATGMGGTHGADCRWCPLCSAAAVLRGERPELTTALADALGAASAALRAMAGEPARAAAEPGTGAPGAGEPGAGESGAGESGAGESGAGEPPAPAPGPPTGPLAPRPVVQRIEIA